MSKIIYRPRTIDGIRHTLDEFQGSPETKFVSISGRVAAYKVRETPYEKNSSMNEELWDKIHGSGLVVGFLYEDKRFLHFSARTPENDLTGDGSDLAMILEASRTTGEHVVMEGEIQLYNPPRMWLHRVTLKGGFNYTTQQGHRADK